MTQNQYEFMINRILTIYSKVEHNCAVNQINLLNLFAIKSIIIWDAIKKLILNYLELSQICARGDPKLMSKYTANFTSRIRVVA